MKYPEYLAISLFFFSFFAHSEEWYFGKWIVVAVELPSVSAMDDSEAERWIGSALTYSQRSASFRGERCDKPSYEVEDVSEGDFYSYYRFSFSDLGIAGTTTKVLNVSCSPDWIAPGSSLISAGSGIAYTSWDGAYFKVEKKTP